VTGLDAAEVACVVADRSDLSRLIATGPDLLALLHRLSTGDVKHLGPGEGRSTVVTNAKGRIVERLFVHHLGADGVLLVGSPGGAPRIVAHFARYTFAENTGISDVTASTIAFVLLGPRWPSAARRAGIPDLSPFASSPWTLGGLRIHAMRTNGFDADGVLVFGPRERGEEIRAALLDVAAGEGGRDIDAVGLEAWRILKGHPVLGHELTDEHNPLEAGLRDAVSFTKGCYVGQEVVARLNTYGKVSRRLVRLELAPGTSVPTPGAALLHDGREIGTVTSAILPPGRQAPGALGYVKSRELPAGADSLAIDDAGTLRSVTVVHS
jgi:folate-binding protein YgfZ